MTVVDPARRVPMLIVDYTALVFFEHAIVMDREIKFFWTRKFSGAAVLFLTNRYLIILYSVLSMVPLFDNTLEGQVS